jgi:putative thioredoxin
VSLAAEAALAEPDNPRIPLDIAKLLVLQGRYGQARDLLAALPDELRNQPDIRNLLAHIDFILTAQTTASTETLEQASAERPDDLEARYRLAARRLLDNDYDGAVHELLEIVRRDRSFRDDCGYHGIQAILQLLSQDEDHARHVQQQLQDALRRA